MAQELTVADAVTEPEEVAHVVAVRTPDAVSDCIALAVTEAVALTELIGVADVVLSLDRPRRSDAVVDALGVSDSVPLPLVLPDEEAVREIAAVELVEVDALPVACIDCVVEGLDEPQLVEETDTDIDSEARDEGEPRAESDADAHSEAAGDGESVRSIDPDGSTVTEGGKDARDDAVVDAHAENDGLEDECAVAELYPDRELDLCAVAVEDISALDEAVPHAAGDTDGEELAELLALEDALTRDEPDTLGDLDREPRSLAVWLREGDARADTLVPSDALAVAGSEAPADSVGAPETDTLLEFPPDRVGAPEADTLLELPPDRVGTPDTVFALDALGVAEDVLEAEKVEVVEGVCDEVGVPVAVADEVTDEVCDAVFDGVPESEFVREGLAPRVVDDVGVTEADAAALFEAVGDIVAVGVWVDVAVGVGVPLSEAVLVVLGVPE